VVGETKAEAFAVMQDLGFLSGMFYLPICTNIANKGI